MGVEQSTLGGPSGFGNQQPLYNSLPVGQEQPRLTFGTHGLNGNGGPGQQALPSRSRRRPLASLYSSEPTSSNRGVNDENRPQNAIMAAPGPQAIQPHQIHTNPFFQVPQAYFRPIAPAPFGASGPTGAPIAAAPAEPLNKMFKLEMNISQQDGQISGRLVVGDGQQRSTGAAAHSSSLCIGCNTSVADEGGSHHSQQGGGSGKLLSLEEMNRQYNNENLHLLYKINNELMVDVGQIDNYHLTGLARERKQIEDWIFRRMDAPQLFDGIRQYTTRGVILYGPSGSGKTVLARTIAAHISQRYLNVQPYYLDNPDAYKLLIAIFRLASQTAPSVIVFENIDHTFRENRNLQLLFASEFHRSVMQKEKVVIIGTMTACYHYLPKQVKDCFEHRIFIGLPEEKERRDLITSFMSKIRHNLTRYDIKTIADATPYFTRGQMELLCRTVSLAPTFEIPSARLGSTSPTAIRPVSLRDFETVLVRARFPGSPNRMEDSSMEISSTESSQTSSSEEEVLHYGPAGSMDVLDSRH